VARWAEEPRYLLQQIRGAARGASASAALDAKDAKRAREPQALLDDVRRRLGPVRRRVLFAVLKRTARGVAARENGRSEATRRLSLARQALLEIDRRLAERGLLAPGDLFFLTLEEAGPALAGAPLRARVLERRRAHASHLAAQPPAVIVADGRELEPDSEEATALGDRILRGIGASPGVVEGPARVILREDAESVVEPGEILIAPFTDPGWTPYLAAAAGVVMDFGGILSHGSVLAREYGIPAVVNVKAGTRTIQSGQRVRVDGSRGLVEVLDAVARSATGSSASPLALQRP
jgi:pyruvate,water dikinase